MLGISQHPYLPMLSPVFMRNDADLGRLKQTLCFCNGKAMGLHPKSYGFVEALPLHVGALSLRAEVMPLYIIILV